MFQKIWVLVLCFGFIACATSTKNQRPLRGPASLREAPVDLINNNWRILEFQVQLKNLKGYCDFQKPSKQILDYNANIKSNAIGGAFLNRLHLSATEENMGCKLNYHHYANDSFTNMVLLSPTLSGIFTIQIQGPDEIFFRYGVGKMLTIYNESDLYHYTYQGWEQIFPGNVFKENAAYLMKKLPLIDELPLSAKCLHTSLRGTFGFRKKIVTCYFDDDQGFIKLEEN